MESNNTNEEFFIGASPLAEPHFDEEATLLSARPVVPLDEVKTEILFRKRVLFGLAMVGSLTLGALATSLIYKQRGNEQSPAISTAVPGVAGIANERAPAAAREIEDSGSAALATTDTPTVEEKPVPPVQPSADSNVIEPKPEEPLTQLEEGRELTRAERINARRLRRRFERQERREINAHQRKSSDDVLRIREIFEGPDRP